MLTAETISRRLAETVEAQIKVYPVNNLSASRLGHPCERYLYFLIKNWQDRKPHDAGLQNIFNLGNSIEEYTIEQLKKAGFECITPTVRSWKVERPLITGREDVRIKDPETGELIPCEIKGLSPYDWEKLNTIDDFLKSKKAHIRGYPAQLFVYMYHFAKERGFFIITNKLTGQIKPIEVHLDYEYGEECLQKAERVYKAVETNTPPPACEEIGLCENCDLKHICGECRRAPADFELDGELEDLIARKEELSEAKKEFEEVDRRIKEIVGDRDKIITGTYLVERRDFVKKAFTVPESTQYRISIKRL